MKVISISIILSISLLALGIGYYYFPQGKVVHETNSGDSAFEQGDTRAVEKIKQAKETLPFGQSSLYAGYILREQGRLGESDRIFSEALMVPFDQARKSEIRELYVNRMLNASLQNDYETLARLIGHSRNLFGPEDGWLLYFRGLEAFARGNYAKASQMFRSVTKRKYYSSWMKESFQKQSPEYLLDLFLAKSEMHEGNVKEARSILENMPENLLPKHEEERQLLLELSEGEEVSPPITIRIAPVKMTELVAKSLEVADNDYFKIEDASASYAKNQFDEAKKIALEVVKKDPENTEAKRILGLISYQEGNYRSAYGYFKDLQLKDPSELRMQTIVFLLNGDEGGKTALEKLSTVNDEFYFTLAYGSLIMDQPVKALEWFKKIKEKTSEKLPGLCFASFAMNSWEETLKQFRALSSPYKDIDGFQGIAIESLTALGKIDEAEKMLEGLLKKFPEPGLEQFPAYFQVFKKKKLDRWNRNYVAAIFYKEIKKDPKRSLDYFSNIENATPIGEIEKAELLIDNGNREDGRTVLLNVLKNIQGSEDEKKVKTFLLPLLAKTMDDLGYHIDALAYYKEYFELNPNDLFNRDEFAKSLMRVKRYDLALAELKIVYAKGQASPNDTVLMIECLIRTAQFAAADEMARKWLASGKVPFLNQLQIARLMIITKNKQVIDTIIRMTEEKEKKTLPENQEFIRLMMELGNYEAASALASVLTKELEKTTDGLMVLVDLNIRLSENVRALDYLENAAQIDPGNIKVIDYIDQYEKSSEVIVREAKLLGEKHEQEPGSLSLQIDYGRVLIDQAIETYSAGVFSELSQSADLQNAQLLLENVVSRTKEIPAAYFSLGKVYYLLDKDQEAIDAYNAALRLDPSYTDASQHLALIYEDKKEFNKAIGLIEKATTFEPSNGDVWIQLADLYSEKEDYNGAAAALVNALRYKPNDPRPYKLMAQQFLKNKAPDKAVTYLEKALGLAPKDPESLILMLTVLYNPDYIASVSDKAALERLQISYFDKLQAVDPKKAEALRKQLNVTSE